MAATIPTNGIVLSSGLNVADGDVVMANGHGISFAATGDAGAATPTELLDDYEEGRFTAQLYDHSSTTNFTMSSTYTTGYYTKVGNTCFFHAYVVSSSINSTSGYVRLSGLPFTAATLQTNSGTNNYAPVSIPYAQGLNITAGQNLSGYVVPGTSYIVMTQYNATTVVGSMPSANWTDDGGCMVTGHYRTT